MDDIITCIDDEIPYNIPSNWIWTRLEVCCEKEIKRGKSPKYTEKSNVLVFAQKCNTKNTGINLDLALYLDETTLSKYSYDEYMHDMDTVINSTGTGTLGRVGIYRDVDNPRSLPIVPDSHVTIIRVFRAINAMYCYYYIKACQPHLENKGEGSTNQKELKPITLKTMLFPIPPHTEQIRIIECISALYNLIDDIEKSIS